MGDTLCVSEKLATTDRSAKTLKAFTNRIRNSDLTNLMDAWCKGCILSLLDMIFYTAASKKTVLQTGKSLRDNVESYYG